MSKNVSWLMIQFLDWVGSRPRTYEEIMEAWHTSCPRQSIWEDASIDGLVGFDGERQGFIVLTPKGQAVLSEARLDKHPRSANTST